MTGEGLSDSLGLAHLPVERGAVNDYLPILLMVAVVVTFVLVSLGLSRVLAPHRPNAAKRAPYECGIVSEQEPAERFSVKFYLVAMSFIVLDVEIVFLYPFALVFRDLGLFGILAVGFFVFVLLVPFAYLLSVGALSWGSRQQPSGRALTPVRRSAVAVLDPGESLVAQEAPDGRGEAA